MVGDAPDLSPDTPVSNSDRSAADGKAIQEAYEEPRTGQASSGAGELDGDLEVVEGYNNRLKETRATASPDTNRTPDAAWATYGPPPLAEEIIVGQDDRVRILDTTVYPWSANACLQIVGPDNRTYLGTGWFIGERTLVTAGHCVFMHDHLGRFADWVKAIRVMPGRNGKLLPFGTVTTTSFHSVIGWKRDKDPRFDYGAISLPADLGGRVGWFGLALLNDESLVGTDANIGGYPGDKTGEDDGTQWYDAKRIVSVEERKLQYPIDTFGGESGSAVFITKNAKRYAVGIHAYGDAFGNSATRISEPVWNNLRLWNGVASTPT